ncbi:MAG: transcriptional regulator [Rhizobiales bacterium]|nr:transcriptional regulator [Hyphomicrobiales bacterium]
MANLIEPLSLTQIEKLTIDAIQEHRALLAKAEAAFESLESAEAADAGTAGELRETYTRMMLAARAQQMVLAALIERLGFIPSVPSA